MKRHGVLIKSRDRGSMKMLKNISWDTKDKLKVMLILFLVTLSKMFFESIENGFTSAFQIVLAIVTSLAFAVFIAISVDEKGFGLASAQGFSAAATVAVALGIVMSYRLISRESMYALLFASVMVLLAQRFYLLPVAAALGFVVSLFPNRLDIYSVAMSGIPAAIGVSCICLSEKIKESPIWEKIVFAVIQLFMIVTASRVFEMHRGIMTFHNVKTQMWDSAVSLVCIIVFIMLAVYFAVKKRNVGEIFGCVAIAAFGIVPITMEMKYVFASAMAMLMALTVVLKEGSAAEMFFDAAVKSVGKKIKKK